MTQDEKKKLPSWPTRHERKRIECVAHCDERTILRLYRGQRVKESSALRILTAIQELGIEPPRKVNTGQSPSGSSS